MQFRIDVEVMLKRAVNDPQGLTINEALKQLGFEEVSAVRAGKHLEVWLEAVGPEAAERRVIAMCEKLLANPVIETYRCSVVTEDLPPGVNSGD